MKTHLNQPLSKSKTAELLIDGVAYAVQIGTGKVHPARYAYDAVFARSGEVWEIAFAAHRSHFADSVGLAYIQELLRNQHHPVHVRALITRVQGDAVAPSSLAQYADANHVNPHFDCPEEISPSASRKQYQAACEQLEGEIVALRKSGEPDAAAVKEDELNKIHQHLSKYSYENHHAKFSTRGDCDRKSVGAAIRRSIQRISKSNPGLGRHFGNSLKTGYACSYEPERRVNWVFEPAPRDVAVPLDL